jgi:hypothetical protein
MLVWGLQGGNGCFIDGVTLLDLRNLAMNGSLLSSLLRSRPAHTLLPTICEILMTGVMRITWEKFSMEMVGDQQVHLNPFQDFTSN